MALSIHDRIANDRNNCSPDVKDLQLFRKYVKGDQRVTLTQGQRDILKEVIGEKFCDNVCLQIVGESADRILLMGWTCTEKAVNDYLAQLFKLGGMGAFADDTHLNMVRDGNTVVALGWSERSQRVTFHHEDWWDGSQGVFIYYDEDNEMEYGVKEWIPNYTPDGEINNSEVRRRNIWREGAVERYISRNGLAWDKFYTVKDNGTWPLWKRKNGTDLPIPYIHFANAGKKQDNIYGLSDLSGGVIGFQDQINDSQYALSAAGRLTAYQMYKAKGITLEKDEKGRDILPEVGPGRLLYSESPDADFDRIPAGDLTPLISLYTVKLQRVAQMTDTPFHVISGKDWPSANALEKAERPAVRKANRNISKSKPRWIEVAHRAIEIRNAKSSLPLLPEEVDAAPLDAIFAPAERIDRAALAQLIQQIGGFISRREGLRMLGYGTPEIDKIIEEKIKEAEEFQSEQVQSNNKRFDNGQKFGKENERTPTRPATGS